MQSAAAAARGIAESFTRLIELLSLEEERAGNVAEFSIVLMDSEDDAEISMRLAILDSISTVLPEQRAALGGRVSGRRRAAPSNMGQPQVA